MIKDKVPPFFFFLLKILPLSKPPHQGGARTYDPEDQEQHTPPTEPASRPLQSFFHSTKKKRPLVSEDGAFFL